MGTPTKATWADGVKLAAQMKFRYPQFSAVPLAKLIPSASTEALELMTSLCAWDPAARPTAAQCLQHPYFQVGIRSPLSMRSPSSSSAVQVQPAAQAWRGSRDVAGPLKAAPFAAGGLAAAGARAALPAANSGSGEHSALPSLGSLGPRNARYKAGVVVADVVDRENDSQNGDAAALPLIRNMMGRSTSNNSFPVAAAAPKPALAVGPGLGVRYGLGRRY